MCCVYIYILYIHMAYVSSVYLLLYTLIQNHTHSQDPIEEFPGSVSTAIGVHGTAYGSRMLFIHLLS